MRFVPAVASRFAFSSCLVGVRKIRSDAANVGERWRDEGEFIPFPLFSSPKLRPAMSILIRPACSGQIPPRVSSNCPSLFGQA